MNICDTIANDIISIMLNYVEPGTLKNEIKTEIADYLTSFRITKERKGKDLYSSIDIFLYAKKVDGVSVNTLKSYKQQLTAFASYVNNPINKITTEDIRKYITYLHSKKLENSSVLTTISVLKSFFSWLTVEEMIKKNPMLKIKSMKIDKIRLRHALTKEQINKLRRSCSSIREKAIFELIYSTGCRVSEVVNIDISDINFNRRFITIIGKGDKKRFVFFSERSKACLLDYLAIRKGNDSKLFVSSRKPYKGLTERTIQQIIKSIGVNAGIENIHPHILRHSFATHARNDGMSLDTIQQILGHENANTTQIYAKMAFDMIYKQYNKLAL